MTVQVEFEKDLEAKKMTKLKELSPQQEKKESKDDWALPQLKDSGRPKWAELGGLEKAARVGLGVSKGLSLVGLLYIFVCSISLLAAAFRLLGGAQAGRIFQNNAVLSNPVAGLVIGILATVLVQSSSTSTSIVVTMVSAQLLSVGQAVYIIMGANIGTSITNTIVSVFHSSDRAEFRRAFAAATVHDMFNWLCVFVLLPLEVITGAFLPGEGGILVFLSAESVKGVTVGNSTKGPDFLKTLTKPLTERIVQLDKKTIEKIATDLNASIANLSISKHPGKPGYLLEGIGSDAGMGAVLLVGALLGLCACLVLIVKILRTMLQGPVARLIRRTVNADLPGPAKHLSGYIAIVVGAILTFLVQSSSIFTSTLTPLVAVGVLTLERTYPLTLGSNIGTTGTALIAAFASDRIQALQIALCHLYFNVAGILLWYPIPLLRHVPINLAKALGTTTAEYRWFALAYLVVLFFVVPVVVLGLSLASWVALAVVGAVFILGVVAVLSINHVQKRRPGVLPKRLRTWAWVPEPLRSLAPYDRLITRALAKLHCCRRKDQVQDATTVDSQVTSDRL